MNLSSLITAADRIRQVMPQARPQLAFIMGSGWHAALSGFRILQELDYARIP